MSRAARSPQDLESNLAQDNALPLARIVETLADDDERHAHYLDLSHRRDRADPIVNAFELRSEQCPATAIAPLKGLPISVKDQVAVAGWPRSFGLERQTKKTDDKSASLVARLERLGAVVTGKTALPPNAMDYQTGNSRRGPTCNPHDPRFTAGGSTGGGAAAVASGMSLLDVGADLAGSLRIPAAWCGVSSYVPTEGFWPNDGLLRGEQTLDHFARVGLTARSAQDLAYVYDILEGNGSAPQNTQTSSRIAVWTPGPDVPCDENTMRIWGALSDRLNGEGFRYASDGIEILFEDRVRKVGGEIIGHMTGAFLPAPIRWLLRWGRRAAETSPGFVAHIHTGYKCDRNRYQANLNLLQKLRETVARAYERYDAMLLPVTAVTAFQHIQPAKDWNGVRTYDHQFETNSGPLGYFDAMTRFTLPVTVLGWPVVTLAIGCDDNGLPVGAQLVGKPSEDRRLLALAAEFQAMLG